MKWVTRSHVHLDRVASAWLIARFVDPRATFEFVGWQEDVPLPAGATPFGLPGCELSAHNDDGTTFSKVLRMHALSQPVLLDMSHVVDAGVRWALGLEQPEGRRSRHLALGRALDAIGSGLGVFDEDADVIEKSMPIYDALYVACQMSIAPERSVVPHDPVERRDFWRALLVEPPLNN